MIMMSINRKFVRRDYSKGYVMRCETIIFIATLFFVLCILSMLPLIMQWNRWLNLLCLNSLPVDLPCANIKRMLQLLPFSNKVLNTCYYVVVLFYRTPFLFKNKWNKINKSLHFKAPYPMGITKEYVFLFFFSTAGLSSHDYESQNF